MYVVDGTRPVSVPPTLAGSRLDPERDRIALVGVGLVRPPLEVVGAHLAGRVDDGRDLRGRRRDVEDDGGMVAALGERRRGDPEAQTGADDQRPRVPWCASRRYALRAARASPSSSSGVASVTSVGGTCALDRLLRHDALPDVAPRGQLELHLEQDLLDDRPQAAGAGLAHEGLVGDRDQRVVGEDELDPVELEEALELLDERVARLGEDRMRSSRESWWTALMTGRRPMNSGMRP